MAFTSTKYYRSEVVLIPSANEDSSALAGRLGGLASLAGVSLGDPSGLSNEALARMRSHEFLQDLIADLGLLPVLFADRYDADAGAWEDEERVPTLDDGVRFFAKEVFDISENKTTGLLTLGMEWRDPALAKQWLDEVVRRINAEMRDRAMREAQQSIDYLRKELQSSALNEVRTAISNLLESKYTEMTLAQVNVDYVYRVVDPAYVPDAKHFVRPRRVLLVASGIVLSGLLGLALAFAREIVIRYRNVVAAGRD